MGLRQQQWVALTRDFRAFKKRYLQTLEQRLLVTMDRKTSRFVQEQESSLLAPVETRSSTTGSESESKTRPTLGPDSPLTLSEQLRYLTLQFSLKEMSTVGVVHALELQLKLLEPETIFVSVLQSMIDERRPQLDSLEDEYSSGGEEIPRFTFPVDETGADK